MNRVTSLVVQWLRLLSVWGVWVRSLVREPRSHMSCGQNTKIQNRNPWRRKWQPTPVFVPGEFHGQRSLAGYSPWGRKELDTAERLSLHTHNQNFSMLQSEYNLEYKCRLFPLSYYLGLGREARTGRKTYSRYLIASSLETTDMEDVTFLKTAELPEIGI